MAQVHINQDSVTITVRDTQGRAHIIFETGNLRPSGKYRGTGLDCERISSLPQPRKDGAQTFLRVVVRGDHAGSVLNIRTSEPREQILQAFTAAGREIAKISQGRPDVAQVLYKLHSPKL